MVEEPGFRYENGVTALEAVEKEISSYGSKLSEADTRCKIIDRILRDCLGWNEKDIRREEHVNDGYMDYILRIGKKGLIVEAKKNNPLFELPVGVDYSSNLSIGKLLRKEESLNRHYEQVLRYCMDAGIQFGCFTNGLEWIIFTAIRTDGIRLHLSKVIVFRGINDIKKNFIAFWNLLSRESVDNNVINRILLPESKTIPISYQINSGERRDQILDRNVLAGLLSPILPDYFGDLIGPELIKKLAVCYVESESLSDWAGNRERLSTTVGDKPPVLQYSSRDKVCSYLDSSISAFLKGTGRTGIIYVLLGRIGSGKSTFLNYYLYIKNKSIHERNLVYFINWLEYNEQEEIDDFFYRKIEEISKQNSLFIANSTFDTLEKAFQNDIITLKKGPLGKIDNPEIINSRVADLLIDLSNRREYYYPRLFDYLKKKRDISTLLILDNIDQLEPKTQERIIKFAFSVYVKWSCFTLLSLREENYVKSKIEGSLSTIQCSQILLPRHSIVPIIERRLECLTNDIESGACDLSPYLLDLELTSLDVGEYIKLISKSIVSQKDKVKNFLEAIALGNIRDSLDFFRTFLTAGNTYSGKIIASMKKDGAYLIPDHEFIKSISLGSNRFFAEIASPILNLFSIMDMETPSHFTKLRILQALSMIQHQSGTYGAGYDSIARLKDLLKSIGTSEIDVGASINSMTMKGLIENNLHSRKYLDMANAVRITPAGLYYFFYLRHQFAYLDLMEQDTPILDEEQYTILDSLAESTLMDERFKRVMLFLDYLLDQERMEHGTITKITNNGLLTKTFIPEIKANCERAILRIQRKLDMRQPEPLRLGPEEFLKNRDAS